MPAVSFRARSGRSHAAPRGVRRSGPRPRKDLPGVPRTRMNVLLQSSERFGHMLSRALLTVLRLRGIALSDDERAQILNQNDPSVLERWHERAVVASSIAEVFQMAH